MTNSAETSSAHKIAARIYGVIAILFGIFGTAFGALAIAAKSTGDTFGGIIEKPAAVPTLFGPYGIVISLVVLALYSRCSIFLRSDRYC